MFEQTNMTVDTYLITKIIIKYSAAISLVCSGVYTIIKLWSNEMRVDSVEKRELVW